MIAALVVAIAFGAPPAEVTLLLSEDLPQVVEAARLTRPAPSDPWRLVDVRQLAVATGRIVIPGAAGDETLIIIRVPGRPGYLLHGPFRWPSIPATYAVDPAWRRTVRGRDSSRGTLLWVSTAASPTNVVCEWTLAGEWECLGVPRSASGVVVRDGPAGILYSVVRSAGPRSDVEDLPTVAASWGRLLIVQNMPVGDRATLDVIARPLRLHKPASRPNSIRFEVVADGRVHVDRVGPGALWVTGLAEASASWLEIVTPGLGAARLDVAEIAGGRPDLIVPVQLEAPMAVFGRVASGLAAPLADAIVSLYRLGDEVRAADRRETRRQRIAVGEQHTTRDGVFEFRDLPPDSYELLVLHPQFGRAVRTIERHAPEILITLKPPPVVLGRVVQQGVPRPGVPVELVPALEAFAASEDVTELRGGEGRTDADGRFRVFAAAAGGGELRIGTSGGSIRRIAIPPADSLPPVTELGDIELDAGPAVRIVFEGSGDCQPVLTGPTGSAGLSVVRAERQGPAMFSVTLPEPGRWNVVAICGGRERAVDPPAIDIPHDQREATLVLRWRESIRP